MAATYRFHVHKELPAWRLVIRDDLGFPKDTAPDAWTFTRAREEADVNADVRDAIAARGYCLFKMGAALADLAADLRAGKSE
jgi:hypothetical protein